MDGEYTTVFILLAVGFVAWLAMKALPLMFAAVAL